MVVAIWASVLVAQATPALSSDDVKAAIAAAKAPTPPVAYALKGPSKPVTRNAPLDPEVARTLDPKKILTFGAVYTPFIRAALLARKAADARKPFGPTDIPSEIQDSLTYVAALRWERTDVTGPDRFVSAEYVIVTPAGSTERTQIVQPVWVKTDTSLLRNLLGPTAPEHALLAAFSPGTIQAGKDFVIVYGGAVYAQRLEIRAGDVALWR
jgi:hypothetical protein